MLSPERGDVFGEKTPARSYKDIMVSQELHKEELQIKKAIAKKIEESDFKTADAGQKKRRWDENSGSSTAVSAWDSADETPLAGKSAVSNAAVSSRWDITPVASGAITSKSRSRWDETPANSNQNTSNESGNKSHWDSATPLTSSSGETPAGSGKKNLGGMRLLYQVV